MAFESAGRVNVGGIYYVVELDTQKLIDGERRASQSLKRLGDEGDGLNTRMTAMAAAINSALGAIAIGALVSKIITAQRQFDVMFSSLKTVTGGLDAAGEAFERLRRFAANTPYSLDQSVSGFVKLKALGLDPSERAMTSFGNTAAAMGKDLTQMIEAVADASTGEFERLKEFGIKAKVEKDNVKLTFQGVTTTVKNNSAEIVEYLTKIGEVQFAGAMADRMATLNGNISNLQDSLQTLFLTIAQSGFGDALAAGVRKATEVIEQLTISVKAGGLGEYFDGIRPYIAAAELAIISLAGAITGRLIVAMAQTIAQAYVTATAMGAATVAARGFSAVIATLGGPIGIAVTALALLATNWFNVGEQADDAASISERSAARIRKALAGAVSAPMRALQDARDDALKGLARIDAQLARTERWAKSGRTSVTNPDTSDLDAQREAFRAAAIDAQAAIDKLKAQQMSELFPEVPGAPKATGSNSSGSKPKGAVFDQAGYLAGLQNKTLEGLAKIDAAEAEALRVADERRKRGQISEKTHAEAILAIRSNATKERNSLEAAAALDREALLERIQQEEERKGEQAAEKVAQQREQGRQLALGVIGAADPIAQLQIELEAKSALLAEAAARDGENERLYAEARVALENDTQRRIIDIRRQQQDAIAAQSSAQLVAYSQLFGGIAGLTKKFAGEQSAAYKVMFAASKAFAIADAVIKIQQGIASAAAIPFPANLAAIGSVIAATSSIVSTIAGTNYGGGRQYGGPVSADTLYRVNETGRPEMFTAANGSQYMMPTTSGRVTPADQIDGGQTVVRLEVINQHPTASVTQRAGKDGQPQLVIAEIASQIRDNEGPVWGALTGSTNVRGSLG